MTIDRNSPLPLYYQLKKLLVDQISNGGWKPGDILPTELNLQKEHNLSRTTVRQAIRELELEGLVTRFRGRGTFVAEAKVIHSPEPHNSLTNFLMQQGKNPGWEVLSAQWCMPSKEVANRLKIKKDIEVYCLRRLRLSDEERIGYLVAYISPPFQEPVDEQSFEKGSSLDYLKGKGLLENSHALRILESVPAQEEEAALLGVDVGAPMFRVSRIVTNSDNRPIEDFSGIYRGDRFQYQISSLPAEITQIMSDDQ